MPQIASSLSLRIVIAVLLLQIYLFQITGLFNLLDIFSPVLQNSRNNNSSNTNLKSTKKVPNFILLSPPKCGAIIIDKFLSYHPHLTSAFTKNIRYFDEFYDHGEEWYLNQLYNHYSPRRTKTNDERFNRQNLTDPDFQELFYETSESYFNNIETIRKISNTFRQEKSTKIIISTCNPTLRAYNLYKFRKYTTNSNADFKNFIEKNLPKIIESFESDGKSPYEFNSKMAMFENYKKSLDSYIFQTWSIFLDGFLHPYINWWRNSPFGKSRGDPNSVSKILLVNFEYFKETPWIVLNNIEEFLGIENFFQESLFQKSSNDDKYFLKDISEVETIWGRDYLKVEDVPEEGRMVLENFYEKFSKK